jgi:hypothetical protein
MQIPGAITGSGLQMGFCYQIPLFVNGSSSANARPFDAPMQETGGLAYTCSSKACTAHVVARCSSIQHIFICTTTGSIEFAITNIRTLEPIADL